MTNYLQGTEVNASTEVAGPLIVVADDHPLMRAALCQALDSLRPRATIVQAATVAQTLSAAGGEPAPDLVLMDLRMPDATGTSGIRSVREHAPHVPLAVVSADDDMATVKEVLALGVAGYIPKTDPAAVVAGAVQLILAGGTYVPPRLIHAVGLPPETQASVPGLTNRQVEVLRLLARGLPNKIIARELGVSDGTVKVHLLAVFRALNVRNRTAAVIAARSYLE